MFGEQTFAPQLRTGLTEARWVSPLVFFFWRRPSFARAGRLFASGYLALAKYLGIFFFIWVNWLAAAEAQHWDSMIQNQCRLKSSQYTLIIPHRVIQLTAVSFWIPETRLHLPQVTEQIGQFPPKRVKYRHRHPFFFFFLPHPQESSFALNQSEARFAELGEYSQNTLNEAFWTPNIAGFVAVRRIPRPN